MKKKKASKNKRYVTLSNYSGIRKEIKTGKYIASKFVNGKRYYKSCKMLKEAIHWKNNFHPSIAIENEKTIGTLNKKGLNGLANGLSFGDVWKLYQEQHLAGLQLSTQQLRLQMAEFYDGLINYEMNEITPILLDRYIKQKKKIALLKKNNKRFSFDLDLKYLKAIFNWYQQNYDDTYINPVRSRHNVVGIIKKKKNKNKKLTKKQFLEFLSCLNGLWKELALTQFFIAGRIQEAAGLTVDAVNFEERYVEIKHVMVWDRRTKKFYYLKDTPKNGHERRCFLCPELEGIFKNRIKALGSGCKFLFHVDGEPLSYRQIQYHYDKALKTCGLYSKISGTHIMRYTMATMANHVSGGIAATKIVTGHHDERMAYQYGALAPLDESRRVIGRVGSYIDLEAAVGVSKREQID